jgi:hypothetical protein
MCVVLTVQIIKWTEIASLKSINIFEGIDYKNYKFITFVVILSGLFNSIFTNLVLSQLNQVTINVGVIVRFFIGDILGSIIFILWALIAVKLLFTKKI